MFRRVGYLRGRVGLVQWICGFLTPCKAKGNNIKHPVGPRATTTFDEHDDMFPYRDVVCVCLRAVLVVDGATYGSVNLVSLVLW